MPIYAECGGFMYLGKSIDDGENIYPMAGVVDSRFKLTNNLVRFGYKTLTANTENILCHKGDKIKCHEFHYSDTDEYGDCFTAVNSRGRRWKTTVASDNILAGYPHIHLWSRPEAAENFLDKCRKFAEGAGEPWK
jgi:cobyrinic acid a,c-diamide synthase